MMVAITEVAAASVPPEQIEALNSFVQEIGPSDLRDLLVALAETVQDGNDVTLFEADAELTPAQVAAQLKMSRSHLYKLLDSGQIPAHHVGRDRRIVLRDVIAFERQRRLDRQELATRFAQSSMTRAAALDELLDDA